MSQNVLSDRQFFHGTNRPLSGTVDPGQPHEQNFRISDSSAMYLTEHADEARNHAQIVTDRHGGEPHAYAVHPTGPLIPDVQQRQPGAYKTKAPVHIGEEI